MRPGTTEILAAGSNIKANSQRTAGRRNNRQRRSLILLIELAALGMAREARNEEFKPVERGRDDFPTQLNFGFVTILHVTQLKSYNFGKVH
ncbi:hypothetical protein T02_5312 [Trichinella nativa]|uniref:Uncharacterized protein n=1 Tax=Trichinella nativa TaxID=6335 RepID=A0A0V1KWN5_9BILA|nr:hypothetical protein T02_5312 [Trichinella nativa]